MDYSQRLKDPRWQRKRLEVMERDNWQCRDTGIADEQLQVHHCWYAKGGPWDTPSEYLLTLTEGAHKKRQALEARIRQRIGGIFASMPFTEIETLANEVDFFWRNCDGTAPKIMPLSQYRFELAAAIEEGKREGGEQ